MNDPDESADDVRLCQGVPLSQAVRTDTGNVRDNNEDSWGTTWLPDGSLLVVVCDGMGGHEAGEVASRLAVDVIEEVVSGRLDVAPEAAIYDAMLAANDAILEEGRQVGRRGMGTTAVVALFRGAEVRVGLVGDSRLYHVRAGQVLERTLDHTRVQALLARGVITEEESRDHPDAGMLTRALGHARMSNGQPLEPEVFAEPMVLQEGDAVVMSSDGLHDLVEDWEIAATIAGETAVRAASLLVDLALERGGHDNVTVAVIVCGARASAYVEPEPTTDPAVRPPTRRTTEPVALGAPVAAPAPPPPRPVQAPPRTAGAGPLGDDRLLLVAAFAGGILLFLAAILATVIAVFALG